MPGECTRTVRFCLKDEACGRWRARLLCPPSARRTFLIAERRRMLTDDEARARESETCANAALDIELRFLAVLDTIVRRQRKAESLCGAESSCGDREAMDLLSELLELRAARTPPAIMGTPTFSRSGSELRVDVCSCRQHSLLTPIDALTPAPVEPTTDTSQGTAESPTRLADTNADGMVGGWSFPCDFASLGSLLQLQFACTPEPASPKAAILDSGDTEPTDALNQPPYGWQLIETLGWFVLGHAKRTIPVVV